MIVFTLRLTLIVRRAMSKLISHVPSSVLAAFSDATGTFSLGCRFLFVRLSLEFLDSCGNFMFGSKSITSGPK